jgi:antirestriction protein
VPEALVILSQYGPAGAAIAVLVWYIVRREAEHKLEVTALRTELSSVQEKRVNDAQSVTVKLLEITDQWHKVIADLTTALEEHRDAVDRLAESRKGTRP